MGITSKTRKVLWGNSGALCAFCRRKLIESGTPVDAESVVGDECHIVSSKPNGPRSHIKLCADEYDKPANLILLCKVHHKLIDDQENEYSVEMLKDLKQKHEQWVHDTLSKTSSSKTNKVLLLKRFTSGKDLLAKSSNCGYYLFDHEEPEDEDEMNCIAEFQQNIQDWGDIWSEIDSGGRVSAGFEVSKQISELEKKGFQVFALQQKQCVQNGWGISDFPLFIMTVVRKTNLGITPLGDLATIIGEPDK